MRFAVADHVGGVDLKVIGVTLRSSGPSAVIRESMDRRHVERRTVEGGGAPMPASGSAPTGQKRSRAAHPVLLPLQGVGRVRS